MTGMVRTSIRQSRWHTNCKPQKFFGFFFVKNKIKKLLKLNLQIYDIHRNPMDWIVGQVSENWSCSKKYLTSLPGGIFNLNDSTIRKMFPSKALKSIWLRTKRWVKRMTHINDITRLQWYHLVLKKTKLIRNNPKKIGASKIKFAEGSLSIKIWMPSAFLLFHKPCLSGEIRLKNWQQSSLLKANDIEILGIAFRTDFFRPEPCISEKILLKDHRWSTPRGTR